MEPFTCECGATLRLKEKNTLAALGRHLSSKVHEHRRSVEQMLSETRLRHSEIALELGITRKDVLWIAKQLGRLHGRDRWCAVAAEDRLPRWWNTAGKHPMARKCIQMGFVVQPFMAEGSNNYYRRSIFLVNGHRAVFLLITALRKTAGTTVWTFRAKQEAGADFQVGKAGRSVYIFPGALLIAQQRVTFVDESIASDPYCGPARATAATAMRGIHWQHHRQVGILHRP